MALRPHSHVPYLFTCRSCEKRTYDSRREARAAARRAHPDDLLAAYACPHNPQWWHIGHANPHCRNGNRTQHRKVS